MHKIRGKWLPVAHSASPHGQNQSLTEYEKKLFEVASLPGTNEISTGARLNRHHPKTFRHFHGIGLPLWQRRDPEAIHPRAFQLAAKEARGQDAYFLLGEV